jgi:hypothetical protein
LSFVCGWFYGCRVGVPIVTPTYALQLIGTGKVAAGTMLYAGKIPVAAFTFWLFRISKEKLMTFGWFKRSYELILLIIEKIKFSAVYHRIAARLKQVKAWLKIRLCRPRLFVSLSKPSETR